MKTTEIIEKVKQNLKIQEDLKSQLENDEAKREILQEKIDYAQERLIDAEQNEEVLKENLVQDLKNGAEALKDNLALAQQYTFEDAELYGYGINFKFMGKEHSLFALDYDLSSQYSQKQVNIADFAEQILTDYVVKGKVIFNENTFKSLNEIQRLYNIKPEVITDKLVSMEMERKIRKLQKKLIAKKEVLDNNVADIKDTNAKLAKTKEFKSDFMKKIFTKKEKLQEKRADLIFTNEKLNKEILDIEKTLEDKATMKTASIDYVQSELKSLNEIFGWVDSFETFKLKLVKYRVEHIEALKREILNLKEDYANTQTQIKESKGMLQLNKKINNEIVLNALMNDDFVDGLKAVDSNKVAKSDIAAVKFVENKYHDYLQNCVEKAVR